MKKNNKGFSLVELIGVIVLIALATIIIVPNVLRIMDNNEKSAFEESVKGLIRSVQDYYASTLDNFPEFGLSVSDIDFEVSNKEKFVDGIIVDDNGTFTVVNVTDGKYCANGKRNSLEITDNCESRRYVDYVNLNDFSNWRTGMYGMSTGVYELSSTRLALTDYVLVKHDVTYTATISPSEFRILIRELDKDMNFVKSTELPSGTTFTAQAGTKYLGVSLYKTNEWTNAMTYKKYQDMFSNETITISFSR